MFYTSRTVVASAIMIAISAPVAADTIYFECTVPPSSVGIPMLGGMTCNQVPSHLILRLSDTSRAEQPVAKKTEPVSAPAPEVTALVPAGEPVVAPIIPVPVEEKKPDEKILVIDNAPAAAPVDQDSREEVKSVVAASVDDKVQLSDVPAMYGPIRSGENIKRIAEALFPKGAHRIDEVIAAIVHLNPSAFIHGNPDKIKTGVTIKIPTPEQIGSVPLAAQKKLRPAPTEKPVIESPLPVKPEPRPGILILPGGASPKPESARPAIVEPDVPVAAPTAPAATEPKPAVKAGPASASNEEAKRALMQEIEAIRRQMLELQSELVEKRGG